MPFSFTEDQFLLINLLLRIAVMAGIISLVLGFGFVVQSLVRVSVSRAARVKMAILLAAIFVLGVLVRKFGYQGAMDLSLEGALLAGFLGGTWVGTAVGASIGLVCYLFGETIALPFYTAVGLVSGLLFSALGVGGEIWSYSLNPFFIIYNFFERLFKGRLNRDFIPFVTCLVFAMVRYRLLGRYGTRLLYGYNPKDGLLLVLDLTVLVYALGIALKMASGTRTEIILREEEKQLIHARLTTLRSQINPHFLFNTLNSISALIRTDAEKAREMTRRLSSIFRKSLEDSSDTHSLSDEIKFIEDYLSIERVRFGDDKLRIVKDIDSSTEGKEVPAMILQPIVENAIKHGISRRTDGGTVRIASRVKQGGVEIEVENDGPSCGSFDLRELIERGMGLRNVIERLNIYGYGMEQLSLSPRAEGGAVVRLFIPRLDERRNIVADQGDNRR
jgi:two-component system LytT family sensor kinase